MIDPAADIQKILLADFGEQITVDDGTGPRTITARFVEAHDLVDLAEASIAATNPQVHALATDVTYMKRGDAVTVRGVAYIVAGIQQTGVGLTVLLLSEVNQ